MALRELLFWPLGALLGLLNPLVTGINTALFDVADFTTIKVSLEVYSAHAQDLGRLQVDLWHSADSDQWHWLAGFPTVPTPVTVVPTAHRLHVTGFLHYVRAVLTVYGSVDPILFTFAVNGIAKDGK